MPRPVFVIPHYSATESSWRFLDRAVSSILEQTDPDWDAVIIDDGSPASDKTARLQELQARDSERLHIIEKNTNEGPGSSRNLGVAWAAERRAPFVLFQDADDLAQQDRLWVTREYFRRRPDVDFLYSTFEVVNEREEPVPTHTLTSSIQEILNGHVIDPVEGRDQWLRVALEKGYTTWTSTVAVRTELATAHPFPTTFVSEDSHAWLRMLAAGTSVAFVDTPLSRRRICSSVKGSTTRQRFGNDFYWIKLAVDLDAFSRALEFARLRGGISDLDEIELRRRFHLRQAETMAREQHERGADLCRGLATLALLEANAVAPRPYASSNVPQVTSASRQWALLERTAGK